MPRGTVSWRFAEAAGDLLQLRASQRRFYAVTQAWAEGAKEVNTFPPRLYLDSTRNLSGFLEHWSELLEENSWLAVGDKCLGLYDHEGEPQPDAH